MFAKERGIDLSQVNFQFLKLGASLENTPLFKEITRLDRYFVGFAVVSVLIESNIIFIGLTVLIVVLATKDVQIVYKNLKTHFAKKKALLVVVIFYSSYVMAVVVAITLEKDLLTILAASLSMLLIKMYYHEIVKETLRSAG